ncbi:serine/threonine-protein kinase [Simkania sp.]|uniref:serine/threonine-protein kinase n=1 Tax=Simkania sp. TaxID=34094 RepID=UPI003B525141
MSILLGPFYSLYEWFYPIAQTETGTEATPPARHLEPDDEFVIIPKLDLTERERSVISSQLVCPDEIQFVKLLSSSFRDLTLKNELGSGQTSKVWLVTYLNNRDEHIDKALRISRTDSLPPEHIRRCYEWNEDHMGYEWNALLDYDSPNVLKTEKVIAWNEARNGFSVLSMLDVMALFHDRTRLRGTKYTLYATLSEYLPRVETLQDRIKSNPHFTLAEIQSLARQIFRGLVAIQRVHPNLMHRDIKPANMLLCDGILKICDFGYSKIVDLSQSIVGSPLYMAPEIFIGETYNNKADIYSVFAILFQMATQSVPSAAQNQYELFREIELRLAENKEISADPSLDKLDPDLKDLIARTGKLNPNDRPSAAEALNHPFFTRVFPEE